MTSRRVPSRRTFVRQSLAGLGGLPAAGDARSAPPLPRSPTGSV